MTDINKLIEQESLEYAQIITERISLTNKVNSSDFALAVKHGASFILHQNRWRKVEDELPGYNEDVLLILDNGDKVIAFRCYEEYFTSHNGIEYLYEEVAHWKPIE